MRLWAIVFNPWPDHPVYHLSGGKGLTKCGRKIGSSVPWLPRKHAAKFARPCRSCVPRRPFA